MEYKFIFTDGKGNHEAKLDMSLYKAEGGFVAELDSRYPTPVGMPTASEQLFAQCGLYRNNDVKHGVKAAKISAVLEGMAGIALDAASTAPGNVGISRFAAPAAVLAAVQNDIYEDRSGALGQFKNLVGISQSVVGTRYERPVFSYDPARAGRAKPVAQLSEPTAIGLLTHSESSGTIPVFSYGLEVSDQAVEYFTFAEVQKCMSIMATYDMAERADNLLVSMINGDTDVGMSALSSVSGAIVKANVYDSSITTAGALTQKAWISWLAANSKRAPITNIICGIDMAMAIQGRTGRPTVMTDNPTSARIDTIEVLQNDLWPTTIPVYIVTDPNFPANTILGISKPNAIIMYESASANYSSVEQFVTRRSTKFRADFGFTAQRFYDRAFHILSLTV